MATTFDSPVLSADLERFDALVNATSVLDIASIIIFPIVIYAMRNRPLMKARMPYVIITEIIIDLLAAMLINFTQTSTAWLQEDQSGYNCAFGNFIYTALLVSVWHVSLARILLFYKTAQSNTRNHKHSTQSRFDNILFHIGKAIGPKDFQRAHLRYVMLLKKSGDQTGLSLESRIQGTISTRYVTSVTEMASSSSHLGSQREVHSQAPSAYVLEHFVWLLKIAFWSCMWGVLCVLTMTFSRDQRNAINETTTSGTIKYGDSFDCGILTWNIFMQSFYIVWNFVQLGVVVVVSKHARSDSLGMARELLFVQAIFSILWTVVSIVLMLKSPGHVLSEGASQNVIALKLFAGWLHPAVAFSYPVLLTLWRDYQVSRTRMLTIKTEQDVERLWNTEAGQSRIRDICTEGFSLESAMFLKDTDEIMTREIVSRERFRALYGTYIVCGSMFELNLSSARVHAWKTLLEDSASLSPSANPSRFQTLRESRCDVFRLLLDNYRRELNFHHSQV